MFKKSLLCMFLIMLAAIGIFKMTNTDEQKTSKLKNEVKTGYHLFSEIEKKNITLSEFDKSELLRFININMDALSNKDNAELLEGVSENLILELHTPKLPTAPFQRGYLTYTYIIKKRSSASNGVYGEFESAMNRKDDDSPWSYGNMAMDISSSASAYTNFNHGDYKSLGLEFRREFLMTDLELNKVVPNLTPERDHKKFIASNNDIFAFYEFSTMRNSTKLTLVFGVIKEEYKNKEELPKNWEVLYMKRDDAPAFSLPGE